MSEHLSQELLSHLTNADALERLSLRLLREGADRISDHKVRTIYRGHAAQTEEHLRLIETCLHSQEQHNLPPAQSACVGTLQIAMAPNSAQPAADVALGVYALENIEIAIYHVLLGIAERCADPQILAALRQILEEEEEETADLLASNLDGARSLL